MIVVEDILKAKEGDEKRGERPWARRRKVGSKAQVRERRKPTDNVRREANMVGSKDRGSQ